MTVAEESFTTWPRIKAKLEVTTESQSVSGNSSIARIKLIAYESDDQEAWASGIYAPDWEVTAAGQTWRGTWAYDFRPGGLQSYTILNTTKSITHNSAGEGSIAVSASFEDSVIGVASPSLTHVFPDIQRVPGAPTPNSLNEIKPTSMRYRFTGTSSGGSPVLEWQIGYGLDADTPEKFLTSDGDDVVGGLLPNRKYYFWSRGRNANGWGPWSTVLSATTLLGGVRIKYGGAWRDAIAYVKVAGVWKQAIPFVKHSGAWKSSV